MNKGAKVLSVELRKKCAEVRSCESLLAVFCGLQVEVRNVLELQFNKINDLRGAQFFFGPYIHLNCASAHFFALALGAQHERSKVQVDMRAGSLGGET